MSGDKAVEVWGTGKARREFLFVDDLANAVAHVMGLTKIMMDSVIDERLSHLNVGTGSDTTIAELADLIREEVGFDGELLFDPSKPDGTPRKLLDVSKLDSLGWRSSTSLDRGIGLAYEHFR